MSRWLASSVPKAELGNRPSSVQQHHRCCSISLGTSSSRNSCSAKVMKLAARRLRPKLMSETAKDAHRGWTPLPTCTQVSNLSTVCHARNAKCAATSANHAATASGGKKMYACILYSGRIGQPAVQTTIPSVSRSWRPIFGA